MKRRRCGALLIALMTSCCVMAAAPGNHAYPSMVRLAGAPSLIVSREPISHRQWQHCVRSGGCHGYRPERQGWSLDSPVVNVNLDDALAYAQWLGHRQGRRYRLPYEDEWLHIALGAGGQRFPWGDDAPRGRANCLDCGSPWDGRGTHRSGRLPANAAGLFDVAGNVAQWAVARPGLAARCSSAHEAAIVGASWADPSRFLDPRESTCLARILRDDTIGFRLVSDEATRP